MRPCVRTRDSKNLSPYKARVHSQKRHERRERILGESAGFAYFRPKVECLPTCRNYWNFFANRARYREFHLPPPALVFPADASLGSATRAAHFVARRNDCPARTVP